MTSSMITSEKRFTSSRRGGMTVLGKVAVPKPINLPSQRLENHGLEPNVEIVPKGTHGWGSRPSSAGSNAWGSSALSPRTDVSSISPSHTNGRPSSGGGTRPLTAGSERAIDSANNAWGSNSRPSSASGALMSNQSSLASLRPGSAETRPGSSQLSRFADPMAESSGAWASAAAVEKLGVATSMGNGFSLSSGDFPTLGSDKNSGKNMDSIDNGRPGSSSGGAYDDRERTPTTAGDDIAGNTDAKGGSGNIWRKDGLDNVEDRSPVGMERWHGDPYAYPNSNMVPHPYESWCGAPPVIPPGGGWYRGPPASSPYGAPIRPGGFPMEHFPYYRPQVLGPGLPNSQPCPPSGAGSHGYHPKNGGPYRPHLPEPYMRPGMTFRPGLYPGPGPYEGCYGPMGFRSPNEREFPFMGMAAAGPPASNRYPNHYACDPSKSHARSGDCRSFDHVESGPLGDPRRSYRVPPSQNNAYNNYEGDKWRHKGSTSTADNHEEDSRKTLLVDNPHVEDQRTYEEAHNAKYAPVEVAVQSFEEESCINVDAEVPGNAAGKDPVAENIDSRGDHTLIRKIEGLNAKARASEGRYDIPSANQVPIVSQKACYPINEASAGAIFHTHHPSGVRVPVSCDTPSLDDKCVKASVADVKSISRRAVHGMQHRSDHHSRARHDSIDADGWQKGTVVAECSVQVQEHRPMRQPIELQTSNKGKDATEMAMFDPNNSERAKMRETANQRAIQRQKEEEERTREQKAKAFAKLEELNRHSSSANRVKESSNQKPKSSPPDSALHKQKECEDQPQLCSNTVSSGGTNSVIAISCNTDQIYGGRSDQISETTVSSGGVGLQIKRSVPQYSISSCDLLPSADRDVCADDAAGQRTVPQVHEATKQKKSNFKQKQYLQSAKISDEKSTPTITTNPLKGNGEVMQGAPQEVSLDEVASPWELNTLVKSATDAPARPRKKTNKGGKNKHKLEDLTVVSKSAVVIESDKARTESSAESKLNPTTALLSQDSKNSNHTPENLSALPFDNSRGNNSGMSQHTRKISKISQGRSADKTLSNDAVVWAVKAQNKSEAADDINQITDEAAVPSAKSEKHVQSSGRSKRAEIERYVPKPAAKEQAQQGSSQAAPSNLIDHPTSDETSGKGTTSPQKNASAVKAGPPAVCRLMDSRTRQTKALPSWRQRVPIEQGAPEGSSFTANHTKDALTSTDTKLTRKRNEDLGKGPGPKSDEASVPRLDRQSEKVQSHSSAKGNAADCWSTIDDLSASALTFVGVRDHGISSKGKRHQSKGYRGGPSSDPKYFNTGETDYPRVPVDANQTDRTNFSKEDRSCGDRSLWQPKSRAHVFNDQRDKSHVGSNVIREHNEGRREKSQNSDLNHSLQYNHDTHAMKDQQEKQEGRDTALVEGPNQGLVVEVEAARQSSGPHTGRNYGGRPVRVLESHDFLGNNRYLGHTERQRHNLQQGHHHPVRPQNNRKSNNTGQSDNGHPGQRFRERGQNHSWRGRGNFHGRRRGSSQVDAGFE